jgi:hypothetical protein
MTAKMIAARRAIGILLGCSFLALLSFWLVWPGIGVTATYDIAEGSFQDYAKHMGKAEQDFVAPPRLNSGDANTVVRLDWRSRSLPNCVIQVDVDRKTANARPSWQCSSAG